MQIKRLPPKRLSELKVGQAFTYLPGGDLFVTINSGGTKYTLSLPECVVQAGVDGNALVYPVRLKVTARG